MDALGLNRVSKDGRDQAAKILGGLISDGTLVVRQEEDHRRHKINVVRPGQEWFGCETSPYACSSNPPFIAATSGAKTSTDPDANGRYDDRP